MRLLLNEELLLDRALNEKYIDEKKPSNTIKVLAKHYFSTGLKKSKVIESIDNFFKENKAGYNSVRWRNTIEDIVVSVRKTKDYKLINISVGVTKNEIDKIKEYGNLKYEKLLFTLLVYSKIYNQLNSNDKNWVNEQHKYIFSDAKIAIKAIDQGKMLYQLKELGYIDIAQKNDCTNVKVKYIDENSDVVIEIHDFRNLVFEYMRYFEPDKYMKCKECGLLIKYYNNKKYCDKCAIEVDREKANERMKNIRNVRS